MENIIKHWVIDLEQQKNSLNVFRSNYCPFYNYKSKTNKIFRYNKKLNVIKCYHCGKSARSIKDFINKISIDKVVRYDEPKENDIYDLPF